MAVWQKEEIPIPLFDKTTGLLDTTNHTVEVYPMDQAYPGGKVTCTRLSGGYTYQPDSDLDDETHYWIRVDGVDRYPLFAKKSYPAIGG
jgi:hypothetical protein